MGGAALPCSAIVEGKGNLHIPQFVVAYKRIQSKHPKKIRLVETTIGPALAPFAHLATQYTISMAQGRNLFTRTLPLSRTLTRCAVNASVHPSFLSVHHPIPSSLRLLQCTVLASDNLSTSLSLFPAETEDTSLLSVALPGPPTLGGSCCRNDVQKRQLSSSVETHTHGGGSGSGGVGADSGGSGRGGGGIGGNVERGDGTESKGGDVGRLWMVEDGGCLCVDLLLERTLDELAEGLHFAMRCVGAGTAGGTKPKREVSGVDCVHTGVPSTA